MNKLIKKGKIALVVSLTISTVVWSIGLAAFTPTVLAASAGDLIKQEGSASVYYLGTDGKRYVFPNQSTFQAWYGSSATVTTVSSEELLGYELGGNAIARAGRLVQVVTNDTPWMVADAKVYALSNDGAIHHIDSATTAVSLFGSNWESRIIPIPEQLFSNYTVGAQLTSASTLPDGFIVTDGTDTYLIDGGAKRAISAEGFTANKFKESDKITMTSLTAYTDGSAVSGAEAGLFNIAGGASSSTPVVGGGLTVGLAANTPAAANIPLTAPRVNFLKFTLAASSEADVTVNTLVLKKTGLGAAGTITDVYLYEGSERLTTNKSVNSTTKDVTFSNLGLVIPAGTTKTIDVRAKMQTTAASIHGFSIESASSITTSGATISGSFPITGNEMSSVSVSDLGAVTIAKAGTTSYTRKIGSKDVEVGKFTLAVTQEDATFKGITIYNSGNDIYDNMKLYRGSTLLGTATESGRYFVFNFATPDTILKSDSTVSYTLKADIASDNTSDSGTLYLKYDTDLDITGNSYGYNLAVTSTLYDGGAAAERNATTLEAGAVTIAFNGPATSNISVNTTDVTLLDFSIYAQSATKIERDEFAITLTNADGDTAVHLYDSIENVELVCNGTVMADYTLVDDTSLVQSVSNTDQWELAAGETKSCILRVDVKSGADSGDTISAAITTPGTSTVWTITDTGTDTAVSSVVPSATITGNTLSLISASLTVTAASTPTNRTWVKGATAEAVGFNFAAADSNNITVTSIVLDAALDAGKAGWLAADWGASSNVEDVIDSVSLWDGDTQIGQTEGLTVGSSSITATFDNLTWVVPKGTTKKLTVKAKISNNAPYTVGGDYFAFSIAASNVTAEYGTGTSLTGVPSAVVNRSTNTPTYYQEDTGAGTLSADIPTNTPATTVAVAGSTNVPFSKIKFTATNEDFIISKLVLKNASSAYSTTDYDDDIATVKVTYPTNGAQTTTETKTCTLSSGIATCTGLNIFVPNPNITGNKNYAVIDVSADMQTIIGGADAADAPAFTLSLNGTFEALGKDSNTVITQKTVSIADVIGTPVTTGVLINNAGTAYTTTTTALVVDGNSATTKIAVGDFLSLSTPSEVMYVSGITDATHITVVRGVNGTTALAATVADNAVLYVYGTSDTTADLLTVNAMKVYGTKLTIASGTPAHGGQNVTEEVMKFTAASAAQGDAKIRQGMTKTTATEGTDTSGRFGVAANTTYDLDGSSMAITWTGAGEAASTIQFAATAGTLDDYARVSFWVYWYDASASDALTMSNIQAFTSTDATVANGQGAAISSSTCTEGAWCHIDMAVPSGTDASDVVFGIALDGTGISAGGAAAAGDIFAIDDVKFYNEKIQVDMTLNSNVTIPAAGNTSYLLQNGTIVATGTAGWDTTGSNNETGSIVFVPTGTYGDIEISGTDTFAIQTDTTIFTNSSNTETLTLTINLGNSSSAGNIYWYDDEGSAIVSYTGVNATDKISNTDSY